MVSNEKKGMPGPGTYSKEELEFGKDSKKVTIRGRP
jgi:hypothetical protein